MSKLLGVFRFTGLFSGAGLVSSMPILCYTIGGIDCVNEMNNFKKEKCELCRKFIYIHDIALVCNLDHKIYHAKCLKIENDVALEIKNSSKDWYCPYCLHYIFPFFDENTSSNHETIKCHSCSKFISSSKHQITSCAICQKNVTKHVFRNSAIVARIV